MSTILNNRNALLIKDDYVVERVMNDIIKYGDEICYVSFNEIIWMLRHYK